MFTDELETSLWTNLDGLLSSEKTASIRYPLLSGDPIRRLVAKCFCLGGKDDINDTFKKP